MRLRGEDQQVLEKPHLGKRFAHTIITHYKPPAPASCRASQTGIPSPKWPLRHNDYFNHISWQILESIRVISTDS